jgi:hypothetical protein
VQQLQNVQVGEQAVGTFVNIPLVHIDQKQKIELIIALTFALEYMSDNTNTCGSSINLRVLLASAPNAKQMRCCSKTKFALKLQV